jgi:two-component system sensor histidine kinase RegB
MDHHAMDHTYRAPAAPADLAAAQLKRLVLLRWLSVLAMFLAALAMPPLLGLVVPLGPLLAVALALAALNLFTLAWLARGPEPVPAMPFVQLALDLLAWGGFLYFTGGATNPLISLFLPLVAIGAAILPAGQAWLLAAVAVGAYSLLWEFHWPIHLHDAAQAARWHLAGMWLTFALSAGVIVAFVVRMTGALRARDRALADARAARDRDEHIVALGNLAAGAAHSLGTPLGTLRILVDELLRDPRPAPELRADLELMREQVDHCKHTLGLLTARAGHLRAEGGGVVSARAWVETVLAQWQAQRPHAAAVLRAASELHGVNIVADATLAQAVHTLVNNAADASPGAVEVAARLEADALVIEVGDRGPGIPADLRAALGRAPLEDRPAGMGIGLFLAQAAVGRCRGRLDFLAREGGGTLARMSIPLARIRA